MEYRTKLLIEVKCPFCAVVDTCSLPHEEHTCRSCGRAFPKGELVAVA